MSEKTYSACAICLFCGSVLQATDEEKPESGGLIHCNQCGQDNDHDSVMEIASDKVMEQLNEDIFSMAGDLFKRHK